MWGPAGGGYQDNAGQRAPRLSTQLRAISLEYSYEDLVKSTTNWHGSRKLGSGTYGAVFKGEMGDGSEVAIKVIDLAALAGAGQNIENAGFEEEVQMLSKFRHPNLVTLMGWAKHSTSRYLIYELLSGGDAFQRLAKSKNNQLVFYWHERLSVCYDAALGLSHMHGAKPQAFHRDIKSANVLLDRHGTAKMADFGLSCTSSRTGQTSVQVKTISGTPGYACPIYSRTGVVTEGSEVYSFGMVMLELLCAMAPAMADPKRPGQIIYPIADNVVPTQHDALTRALRHTDPSAQWAPQLAAEFAQLGLRCVNAHDENQRPKFREVVQTLRRMMETFPAPERVVAGSLPPSFQSGVPQMPASLLTPSNQQAASIQAAAIAAQAQLQAQAQAQAQVQAQAKAQAGAYAAAGSPAVQAAPEAPFVLLLTSAAGIDTDALSLNNRKLALLPSGENGGAARTAVIGRQHQAEVFEAWLPDLALRNCISRTAFEVSWSPTGDAVTFIMKGANPMVVDGKPVARGVSVHLRQNSEVGFLYSTDASRTFLVLKLFTASGLAQASVAQLRATPQAPPPVPESKAAVPVQVAVGGADGGVKSEVRSEAKSKAAMPKSRSSLSQSSQEPQTPQNQQRPAPTPTARPWRLECTLAEGLAPDSLANLPLEVKCFWVQEATMQLGRQHQPTVFEALLAGPSSQLLSFISRTHVNLEVRNGSLSATNLSSNPIYIDRKVLDKGETSKLGKDQLLSFARNEGNQHVNFITFRVRSPEDPDTSFAAPEVPAPEVRSQAPPREDKRRATLSTQLPPDVAGPPPQRAPDRLPEGFDSGGGFKCYEGATISKESRDVLVMKMTPQEAKFKAAGLQECSGFTYEGTANGGPYTIFFKADWSVGTAPGWCAFRKDSPAREVRQQQPPPQRAPTMPSAAPAASSNQSPGPPPPSGLSDSPSKRRPSPVDPQPAAPTDSYGQGRAAGSRLPETRRIDPSDMPDSYGQRDRPDQRAQDRPTPSRPVREPEPNRTPAVSSSGGGNGDTMVVLELSGDGVLDVPLEQRRIGPLSLAEPILVGRRHQPELHRQAIAKECLQFLSRDHFRIERMGNGRYQITAMTNNPIWLAGRFMDEPIELKKDESVPVGIGDRVALGTGSNSTTAEEALRRLSWLFKLSGDRDTSPQNAPGFMSSGLASFKAVIATATSSDRKGTHSPQLEPRSPGPGARRDSQWENDAGGSPEWKPMLPPAEAVAYPPRNDRPSEIFGPEPRLHSESRSSGAAMRAPVQFGDEGSPGGYGRNHGGAIDVTKRDEHDAFSKSGFSFH